MRMLVIHRQRYVAAEVACPVMARNFPGGFISPRKQFARR